MSKAIAENFLDLHEQVEKVREWENKEISEVFLVHAYLLAKSIQEKYDYNVEPVKILTELGIKLDIGKSTEDICSDYCSIIKSGEDINVTIKYYVKEECNGENYRRIYFFGLPKPQEYVESYNNKYFYSLYALVAIIVLKEYSSMMYTFSNEKSKEKDIIEKVTLFLLYIKYDYEYRKRKYIVNDGWYLPNCHPKFGLTNSQLYAITELIYTGKVSEKTQRMELYSLPTFSGHRRDKISNAVINEMIEIVNILEKLNEYVSISQIKCPKELYNHHKSIDYYSFGKIREIKY